MPNRAQYSALHGALEPADGADGLSESVETLNSLICDNTYLADDKLPQVPREYGESIPSSTAPATIVGAFLAQDAKRPMVSHFRELQNSF